MHAAEASAQLVADVGKLRAGLEDVAHVEAGLSRHASDDLALVFEQHPLDELKLSGVLDLAAERSEVAFGREASSEVGHERVSEAFRDGVEARGRGVLHVVFLLSLLLFTRSIISKDLEYVNFLKLSC